MQLTEHFESWEFDCHDGTKVPDIYLDNVGKVAANLEIIRKELSLLKGKECPLKILSGYRTVSHNKKVGGEVNSQHLTGSAADITCKYATPKEIQKLITRLVDEGKITLGGIGSYSGFTHYDIRGKKATWRK